MKAAEARKLKVGDWVQATFGTYAKRCEIVAIDWPRFTLKTFDHRAAEMVRTRNYRNIWGPCAPNKPPSLGMPSWLSWPES